MQILNTTKFKETQDLLGDGFDEFLAIFIRELTTAINELSSANANQHLLAHSQKSACALIGVEKLSDIFKHIEELAKNRQDVSKLVALLPDELTSLKNKLNNC